MKSNYSTNVYWESILPSIQKLHPKDAFKNLVMGSVWASTALLILFILYKGSQGHFSTFDLSVFGWLFLTLLFANYAEAVAEGRGKARADSLKKTRTKTTAKRVHSISDKNPEAVYSSVLRVGDLVRVEAGEFIPGDGEVIHGIATVDESAITGESAPVIRESGGDKSGVTGGTRVLSDFLIIKISSNPGDSFLDKMIGLIEGAKRQKTPNEIALGIVLTALTFLFLVAVLSLIPIINYSAYEARQTVGFSPAVWIALFVCLIPTTIAALLSAIGISGMERLVRNNVIAKSGKAIEAAGDIDVLLLDKTGTITLGNRQANAFHPVSGVDPKDLALASQLASLSDETPEGRSIVVLAKEKYGIREHNLTEKDAKFILFEAKTRMSGVDLFFSGEVNRSIRKGAIDAISEWVKAKGKSIPYDLQEKAHSIAREGKTPILVADDSGVLGLVELKDIIKGGLKERFSILRKMGIKTVMITGDNPLTAAAIAAEAGVDDFLAEATPEAKLSRIKKEQEGGKLVAMIGDGTNDAPALAQADVGVAMNSGTQTAREAGNMIDLDNNPSKLIEVVEIGKKLLMTRGALTTFSIANDVAKYFAILPALFSFLYAGTKVGNANTGPLEALNVMRLSSPSSAILSAVIFNAIIIPALIPLALRGVKYIPSSPDAALLRNVLIYGLGGLIVPFIGIKLIDIIITGSL